ncbi:long-chain acyl-CoA thioesterase FadM [bacterium BMS3Abin03]|nr:long-chain acyl-CoA thioesterase FadM [bacterium BMS3Abin03]HDZ58461.1 acyl-CoA thioesterase [Ignavibacteriales bacterium]
MNTIFSSEIKVRPDDIDMNNHVHNSKYFDYVQAARFEQMINNYKMPMEEFLEMGYNWVTSAAYIEWKRELKLGETAIVKSQMGSINGAQCKVNFWIEKKETGKLVAKGNMTYTMISIKSGRPVRITNDIIERYSI